MSTNFDFWSLLSAFVIIEAADHLFIKTISKAVSQQNVQEIEIASLLLVNRLFTQSCRMQIYSMKDMLLSQEKINSFDRALDMNEITEAEKAQSRAIPE